MPLEVKSREFASDQRLSLSLVLKLAITVLVLKLAITVVFGTKINPAGCSERQRKRMSVSESLGPVPLPTTPCPLPRKRKTACHLFLCLRDCL